MSVDGIGRSGFLSQGNSMLKAADADLGSIVYKEGINSEKLRAKTNLREYSKEDIKSAIRKAEQMAMIFDRSLKFKYVEEANIYQVHVIDHAHDDKVIRKIPPDELVHFIAAVNEMLGALFDTEV